MAATRCAVTPASDLFSSRAIAVTPELNRTQTNSTGKRHSTSASDRSGGSTPATRGHTWPLSWRYPPTAPDRFVHTLLLRSIILGEAESGLS
ncbi:hypothetical protein ABZ845_24370 [Streptomyces sp. NPDC047022]|uniref:hypothetical protein n=1 Tax=Streptomyces sp. NPDC047022 TaxID=3155737 RepID=UPI0033C659F3